MKASIEIQSGILNTLPQPEIKKYFNDNGTPYVDVAQVMSQIPENRRHQGLTVNVAGVEYWWATSDVTINPVIKTASASHTHANKAALDQIGKDANNAPTWNNGAWPGGGSGGNVVRYGAVNPTGVVGNDGDFYINTSNNYLYGPKAAGVWPTGISIVGPQGPAGPAGAKGDKGDKGDTGANGATWYSGSGAPTTQGVNNDYYFRTDTSDIYKKTASSWGTPIANIKGTTGATGPQGPTGPKGDTGNTGPAGPSTPQVINDNSIINAKLSQVATGTIKGRKTAGTGNVEDLTPAEARAVIGVETDPIPLYCSDMISDLTASTTVSKLRFMFEEARTLQNIVGSLATAATGSVLTVDIKKNGTSIFSTLLTFDAGENTTRTAATAAVLTGTIAFAVGDYIDIYITTVGSVTAGKGLLITLLTKR